jgi:hypothetical protein
MRATRIATVAVLFIANAGALQAIRAQSTGNPPPNDNRKEQSSMTDEKVIMLIEAKIQPQRRAELIEALREYLPLVRAEPGVEAFYVTARKDDSNAFVFLRDLQVPGRAGFPPTAGFHEEIPGDAQECTSRGPRSDKSRRVAAKISAFSPLYRTTRSAFLTKITTSPGALLRVWLTFLP